ncbi:hypothetical protein [Leifsonia sp. SIMBA_070]|uniref:hypothetical protein n=1 Tax=Leifsonia sp. SIMBA_070 TaxID=3085810 RepID=UPI00397CA11A
MLTCNLVEKKEGDVEISAAGKPIEEMVRPSKAEREAFGRVIGKREYAASEAAIPACKRDGHFLQR